MKNKKVVIIVAISLIVLFVLATGTFATLYFATDIFKTNEQIFWKYFSENSQITSILSNENIEEQANLKEQNSYTTTGNLVLSTQIGVSDPVEINVATSSIHDKSTGRTCADATLKKADKDLLKVSYINSNNVYSIKCEDISQYYIGFRNENLKELFKKWGLSDQQVANIPDSIDFSSFSSMKELISEEEKQHIKETYSNIIMQTIPQESYKESEKETITINGTNYEANKHTLEIEATTTKQIITNILTTLKNDNTTLEIINKYINAISYASNQYTDTAIFGDDVNGGMNNNYNENSTSSDISSNIDNGNIGSIDAATIVDNLLEKMNEETEMEPIIISVYEQNGKTLRTVLEDADGQNVMIDLEKNQFTLSIPTINSQNNLSEEVETIYTPITFAKTSNQDVTNSITITNAEGETITILVTMGKVQNGTANNSYSITSNTISNDAETTLELSYNTQIATTNQPEEIMELKDDNSVIVNNYPLDQLTTFFKGVSDKAQQVFNNIVQELQSEIAALNTLYGSTTTNEKIQVTENLENGELYTTDYYNNEEALNNV